MRAVTLQFTNLEGLEDTPPGTMVDVVGVVDSGAPSIGRSPPPSLLLAPSRSKVGTLASAPSPRPCFPHACLPARLPAHPPP